LKRSITIKIEDDLLDAVDELVAIGKYRSRSDVIRRALELLVSKELLFPGVYRSKLMVGLDVVE